MGFFPNLSDNNSRVPIWDPSVFRIQKLVIEDNYFRDGPFKFVPLCFDKVAVNSKESLYTPLYALVPDDFMMTFDQTPEYIPMLLRTNYTLFDRI